MSDYGFTIKVEDLTSSQMKKIEDAVKSLGGTVKNVTDESKNQFNSLAESAKEVGRVLVEAFSVYELYNFGKELLHLTAEFQGFENVIKYSSEGIVDSSRNMDYLNGAIARLHLPMKETYESFSEMQAGFYGTGIEGEKLRKVFEGIATASSVLHLNPEQFSRTTYALKEIGELGTVQMRQMRMLAFALPGAMNIAARSMGMTSAQFHEAMKKGEIKSSDFLPKFAESLSEHFTPGLGNAGKSLIAQMNDEKNSILKLMLDMGDKLTPLFSHILSTISSVVGQIKSVWDSLTANTGFVNGLKLIFDIAVKLLPIWIAYRAVMAANAAITAIFSYENGILAATMGSLTIMTDGSTVATEGFGAAIASTGIGAFAVAIGLVIEHLISMNAELDKTIDKKYKLSESKDQFKSINDQAESIKERYKVFNQLSDEDRKKLAQDVGEFMTETRSKIPLFNQRGAALDSGAHKGYGKSTGAAAFFGANLWKSVTDSTYQAGQKTVEASKEFNKNLNSLGGTFVAIKEIGQQMRAKGYTPSRYKSSVELTNGKDAALNTSNLSGASGGLGQAKMIHINIGVMQQNNGVKETKSEAAQAVELLIRELNNMSSSENSQ